ncbi:hypothetical protein KKB83_00990 [Patescibacteria group bacterium]|nr:hypothetical protein [Patescibacteria group bacterium]
MQLETERKQKLITFSPQLYHLVESKAGRVGLSFPDYIRLLAAMDIKGDIERIQMVDERTEERIGMSLEDIRAGRYVRVKPGNEKQLNKLLGISS